MVMTASMMMILLVRKARVTDVFRALSLTAELSLLL